VVSGQWSVVSGQWSVVSGQWSVENSQAQSYLTRFAGGRMFLHTSIVCTSDDGLGVLPENNRQTRANALQLRDLRY